jgi:CHAD domain-containing protein
LSRVAEARARALEYETERDWHKLRIAIKELRYQLDEEPREDRSRRVRQTITACKQLQEELGTWHDTVVHRGLLANALEQAKGPEGRAMAALDARLSREGEECLDRVRALLVEPDVERTLSPGPR